MERWPYVSDWIQLLPHPRLLQVIRILRYVEPCSGKKKRNINFFSINVVAQMWLQRDSDYTICLLSNSWVSYIYLPSVWGYWPVLLPNIGQVNFCFTGKISTIRSQCTCCLWIWIFCRDSRENGLGSQHATLHSCVGAFNLWDIHETRAAANQHSSRERQFWDGLERSTREVVANLTRYWLVFLCYPSLHTAMIPSWTLTRPHYTLKQ